MGAKIIYGWGCWVGIDERRLTMSWSLFKLGDVSMGVNYTIMSSFILFKFFHEKKLKKKVLITQGFFNNGDYPHPT